MNLAFEVLNSELVKARKQVSQADEAIQDNNTQMHENKLHKIEWEGKVKELETAIEILKGEKNEPTS